MPETIGVLGAGSWGATLASLLHANGHEVRLWEFDPQQAQQLAQTRRLSFLPQLAIPPAIVISSDIAATLADCSTVISATPSHFVRSTFQRIRELKALPKDPLVVSVSKGLEEGSLKRMTEVILEHFPQLRDQVAVLSGPSHAEEVSQGLPTAVVAAATVESAAERVQRLFFTERFRVYLSLDVIGTEVAGALKNIFAIACGACDGLGFGDNTKAALMTRGLNEMARVGEALGGQGKTFFGLTGMGDLIVTCISKHSRNRQFGELIGRGQTIEGALKQMVMVVEGLRTTKAAFRVIHQRQLKCPLISEVYQVLYEQKPVRASIHDLMARAAHFEQERAEGKG
ncbi:MAG: NAD(P)-dependent glycerol-3-phosphate dehydrogenase [Elusimicrobia bacterium]|nr:NAD(P)-dependent glycerol-3-phosphate dehydrogenase [Elusimicrobiota bacterium]